MQRWPELTSIHIWYRVLSDGQIVPLLSFLWGIDTRRPMVTGCKIAPIIFPMRNWHTTNFLILFSSFDYYLSYEELTLIMFTVVFWSHVSYYLSYEELTLYKASELAYYKYLLSFLWGIDTKLLSSKHGVSSELLSFLWGIDTFIQRFPSRRRYNYYLSYEELTRNWFLYVHFILPIIFPMRNWHLGINYHTKHKKLLLSFLWGIDTLKKTTNFFIMSPIIFPMRNWHLMFPPLLKTLTIIFPMRNWHIISTCFLAIWHDYYLSYEELTPKRHFVADSRTYKLLSFLWGIDTTSSYDNCFRYFLLSFLWGIDTATWISFVLSIISYYLSYEELTQYKLRLRANNRNLLSFLWGIDTTCQHQDRPWYARLLSFLWGIHFVITDMKNRCYSGFFRERKFHWFRTLMKKMIEMIGWSYVEKEYRAGRASTESGRA